MKDKKVYEVAGEVTRWSSIVGQACATQLALAEATWCNEYYHQEESSGEPCVIQVRSYTRSSHQHKMRKAKVWSLTTMLPRKNWVYVIAHDRLWKKDIHHLCRHHAAD